MDTAEISTPESSTTKGRATLADITNLSADKTRRKRDRERYVSLTAEKKETRLQKMRDYNHRKEAIPSLTGTPADITTLCKIITVYMLYSYICTPDDVTNLSAIEDRRKRDRDRYASLSADQKEARHQKQCDYYQRKKNACIGTPQPVITPTCLSFTDNTSESFIGQHTQESTDLSGFRGHKKENCAFQSRITPRRLPFTDVGNVPCVISSTSAMSLRTPAVHGDITNLSAVELRRKHTRERYASLTTEQKEARNKKAGENRQRKEASQYANQFDTTNVPGVGCHIQCIQSTIVENGTTVSIVPTKFQENPDTPNTMQETMGNSIFDPTSDGIQVNFHCNDDEDDDDDDETYLNRGLVEPSITYKLFLQMWSMNLTK
uniref:Uncharacterized protein n=1 Tax=Leersia perrieri TaxID=77586 RepID=A0A0D9XC10_9ORYZ